MNATITTDASFDPQTKKASYAFWISFKDGPIRKAGVFPQVCEDPHQAEMGAIIRALQCVVELEDITRVFINTDSMTSINVFNRYGDSSKVNAKYAKDSEVFDSLVKHIRFGVVLKHVKAHNSTATPREFVNQWCDDAAREKLGKKKRT